MSKLTIAGTSTEFSGELTAPLTQKALEEIYQILYPPLQYATTNLIERGVFYFIKETEFNPEFIVCHPEDLETLKTKILRPLTPIKEYSHNNKFTETKPYYINNPKGLIDYNAHS